MRKIELANNEYYHIYNRGVDKRKIFMNDKDYKRFITTIILSNDINIGLMQKHRDMKRNMASLTKSLKLPKAKPSVIIEKTSAIVDIITYCLNPNHYHFILKQKENKGVERFMHKLGTSYTMYFNKKYKRSGSLFQGPFKAVHISSNKQLLHLSAYVNKNYFIHGYGKKDWKYSSLLEYASGEKNDICNKKIILRQFNDSILDYKKFIEKTALYFQDKKKSMRALEFTEG